MANEHNLKKGVATQFRSGEEAVRNGRKGGEKSGEVRREKRDFKKRMQAALEAAADPSVARHMSKTGIEISDNMDVVIAGIMKGVLRGDPRAISMALEYAGENEKEKRKDELFEIEKRKTEADAQKAEMETELYKMRLEAIKGIGQEELPDDGFLDALKGTAAEDWSDEAL